MHASLANWRTAPFNRWAFHHVRELIPSADIPNKVDGVRSIAAQPADFSSLRIDPDAGEALGLEGFIRETDTDGMAIVHRGKLVFERYGNGMTEETPHILMSVSKSLLGVLTELLAARGALRLDALVTSVLPELDKTAYRGATIRHLLDMRAGIVWNEDYLVSSGPIVEYRKATGWNPADTPSDLHSFYRTLTAAQAHGGDVHYVSPNSDLLGWLIERATGRRYAELMSELVWKPAGAERSAYVTVDRLGAPRCAGGMCVTLRDLARVGLWLMAQPLMDALEHAGDPKAWERGDLAKYFPGLPLRYCSQWYAMEGAAPLVFGYGIHGQHLFIDRKNEIVVVKVSSQALPIDVARIALTIRAVSELRKLLA